MTPEREAGQVVHEVALRQPGRSGVKKAAVPWSGTMEGFTVRLGDQGVRVPIEDGPRLLVRGGDITVEQLLEVGPLEPAGPIPEAP